MDIEVWHIWIMAAVLLFIAEIFTSGFLTACLALGCIAAGVASVFDLGIEIQLLAFSIWTLIGFFGVRPFMLNYAHGKNDKVKTNVDALIGKTGKVTVAIDNSKNEGRVIVEGDDWRAETEDDETISAGDKVEILRIDSTILIVKPLKK